MKLPKFTAEVSLYKTSGHYQAMRIGSADSSHVVPQLALKSDPALDCLAYCLCCGAFNATWCCYKCDVCLGIWTTVSGGVKL
jgi:hypothetical protein